MSTAATAPARSRRLRAGEYEAALRAAHMKTPTDEQIAIAAAWLRCNDGDGGEADACVAVADWITHLSNQRADRYVRAAARRAGVPLAELRRRLGETNGA